MWAEVMIILGAFILACGGLSSLIWNEPTTPAVEAGSPNHWTARAFPQKTPYVQDSNGFPKCGSVFAISGGYWPPVFL